MELALNFDSKTYMNKLNRIKLYVSFFLGHPVHTKSGTVSSICFAFPKKWKKKVQVQKYCQNRAHYMTHYFFIRDKKLWLNIIM